MQLARWFVPFSLASAVLVGFTSGRTEGGC